MAVRATRAEGDGSRPRRPVHEITGIARSVDAGDSTVVDAVCGLFGIEARRPAGPATLAELVGRYTRSVADDVGALPGVGANAWVLELLDGQDGTSTVGGALGLVADLHTALAEHWAGLLVGFVSAARRRCLELGVEQVVMLARDGIVLQSIWTALATSDDAPRTVLLDLNRDIAGRSGAAHGADRGRLRDHLAQVLDLSAPSAVIDTGMYGTLVHTLAAHGLSDLAVFFLTSKNPDLHGWLNSAIPPGPARAGRLRFASRCVDSVESWPKLYRDTVLRAEGGRTVAVARPTDPFSAAAHLAMLAALARAARARDRGDVRREAIDELERLTELYSHGRRIGGVLPVVLPADVPDWNGRDDFLRRVWEPGPRPPLTTSARGASG